MDKNNTIIVFTSPFEKYPVGGFIRSFKVLPYLFHILRKRGYDIIPYIPLSILHTVLRLELLSGKTLEESIEGIRRELDKLARITGCDYYHLIGEVFLEFASSRFHDMKGKDVFFELFKKIPKLGFDVISEFTRWENWLIETYYSRILGGERPSLLYSMNETIDTVYPLMELSRRTKTVSAIMLQQTPYKLVRLTFSKKLFTLISDHNVNSYSWKIFRRALGTGYVRKLLGVSPAVFLAPGLLDIIRRTNIRVEVPYPANAVDEKIFGYRRWGGRELEAVYFGRLTPEKGVYDLVHIWANVEKQLPDARLRIFGSFRDERVRDKFMRYIERYGLRNIVLMGNRSREEVWSYAARAKVLIYPSYIDAFPLTVLESLALGLIVVAYNIPAIKYVYSSLEPVNITSTGDLLEMSKKVVEALKIPIEFIKELYGMPRIKQFLSDHSSWERVAYAEAMSIIDVVE